MSKFGLRLSPLIAILIGSGVILYINLLAGVTTLILTLVALLLASRSAIPSKNPSKGNIEIATTRIQFAERIKSALSGNFEAKVFNYDDRLQAELMTLENELSAKELDSGGRSGIAPAAIHFIMGANVVTNAILGMSALERGEIDTIGLALLVLIPYMILSEVEFGHAKGEVHSR